MMNTIMTLKFEIIYMPDKSIKDNRMGYFRHNELSREKGPCVLWSNGEVLYRKLGEENFRRGTC